MTTAHPPLGQLSLSHEAQHLAPPDSSNLRNVACQFTRIVDCLRELWPIKSTSKTSSKHSQMRVTKKQNPSQTTKIQKVPQLRHISTTRPFSELCLRAGTATSSNHLEKRSTDRDTCRMNLKITSVALAMCTPSTCHYTARNPSGLGLS